ncbi:UNVERIFIED_CONTAM: hypothetical protein HDU68_004825, partial [Siphonaria sp. JEL0065]
IREYEQMRPYLTPWLGQWAKTYLVADILSTRKRVEIPASTKVDPSLSIASSSIPLRVLHASQNALGSNIANKLHNPYEYTQHYNACMIYYAGEIHDFVGWSQFWMQMENATFWQSYIWSFMLGVGNMFPIAF